MLRNVSQTLIQYSNHSLIRKLRKNRIHNHNKKPRMCNLSIERTFSVRIRILPILLLIACLFLQKKRLFYWAMIFIRMSDFWHKPFSFSFSFSFPKISESSMVMIVSWSCSVKRTKSELPSREPRKIYSSRQTHIWTWMKTTSNKWWIFRAKYFHNANYIHKRLEHWTLLY